jgi:hypothetical protein
MRTLTVALLACALAGCGALSGTVDDGGRAYRETINAPIDARLEPLAAEPSIQILNDRIPMRGGGGGGGGRDAGESSACEAERWQHLIGMEEADVRAERLPESVRVIEWGGMVTQDYQPGRLNVHLDQNGRVYRVLCG